MSYYCSASQLAEVLAIAGSASDAEYICETVDVGSLGVDRAVLAFMMADRASAADAAPASVGVSLDVMFMLYNGYVVFVMQLGFACLCAGSIRSKNCMNILLKNVLDACVGAVAFYLVGYAFAYGHHPDELSNRFIGDWNFALTQTSISSRLVDGESGEGFAAIGWHSFFFQWSFVAATVTLVSGGVAERCAFPAYLGYAFFLCAFVYPVLAHWVWSNSGWLSAFNLSEADGRGTVGGLAVLDFAGAGVVHMTGGIASFMGAWIVGPRIGRFDEKWRPIEMKGHSATLVVMGTFLLWFGWYGFNPGSNLIISTPTASATVARAAVVTTLGAASGGLTQLFLRYFQTRTWDMVGVCNGVLAGLVGVTSGVATIEPWAALIAGSTGALVYAASDWLVLYKWHVDDPVCCTAIHAFTGAWSVIFVGLLAKPQFVAEVYGGTAIGDPLADKFYGAFYGGSGKLLGMQCLEVVVVTAWVGGLMGAYFFIMKLANCLRVPVEDELRGLDAAKHGGAAYDYNSNLDEDASITKVTAVPV